MDELDDVEYRPSKNSMAKEQKRRPASPEEDPNFLAYKSALDGGQFDQLDPTSWLAFADGQLVGSASSRDELLQTLGEDIIRKGPMLTQVKSEPITLRGFFTDPEGNLRRGVLGLQMNKVMKSP